MNAKEIAAQTDKLWGWCDGVVGGWKTYMDYELEHLADAALSCVPEGGLIVEIGTYGGLSTGALLQVAREKNAYYIGCDGFMWNGVEAERKLHDVLSMFPDVKWRFYPMGSELCYEVVSKPIKLWRGLTHPTAQVDHNINFLHIDGDHLCVTLDCNLWLPHVVSGGMIGFHDANLNERDEIGSQVYNEAMAATPGWEQIYHAKDRYNLLIRRRP